jgi:hypothetical protein
MAEITPRLQGPLWAATSDLAAGLALAAGFFAMGLAGAAGVGEGDWAHPAVARQDTKAVTTK